MTLNVRADERRGEGNEKGERGKETGSREVERVLLSSSKSTVNNAGNDQGDKKKSGDGHWRTRERGRKEGREEERKRGGGSKHHSSVPSKHEMLGYFNKKPAFIWERKRHQEAKEGEMQERDSSATGRVTKSWEMESKASSRRQQAAVMRYNKGVFFLFGTSHLRAALT